MNFLAWHYSSGYRYYIDVWNNFLTNTLRYFSLGLLLQTLFSPWKRLTEKDTSSGFDIGRYLEVLTFNLVSRFIGAFVRIALFFTGLFILIFSSLAGVFGIIVWTLLPFLSYPAYHRHQNHPDQVLARLMVSLRSSANPIHTIFASEAGQFVLRHTRVSIKDIVAEANVKNVDFTNSYPKTFANILSQLIDLQVWKKDFFRQHEIIPEDLIKAAQWWQEKKKKQTALISPSHSPAIASELLFGYTPILDKYSTNLSIRQSFAHRLIGRENVVSRIERAFTVGSSVALVGQPGVGKKTVVLEFAHRAMQGMLGADMLYKKVLQFDYNAFLSGNLDINTKKAKLAEILEEASSAGNIILMIKDIQRLTNADLEGYDFTDVFENYMARRKLKIIAVATPYEYDRFIAPNIRLKKYLEKVVVDPPTKEEALEILIEAADRWERLNDITITLPALRKILDESDRYITEIPFPEKALELLDALVIYLKKTDKNIATVDDAAYILAEKTGISLARLTSHEKEKLKNLEEIIHTKLINQEQAVKLISQSLRAKTVGAVNENRPLGSFLFLGPTGVGKTQTAKVLADVYYGSEESILRFDMAEYASYEGLERLIGSVTRNTPGTMTTAIKNHPASLLLLDEFEKATGEIINLFLALLDEGSISDAFGKKIICRHLFVIGTSNAGAEYIRELVTKGVKGESLQEMVVEHVLKKGYFSPELLNRFDGVVVYEPLGKNHLVLIAEIILKEFAQNLAKKGVNVIVTDELSQKVAEDGYDPAFGARPMRRIVNLTLGDLIGQAILAGQIKEGDNVKIVPHEGNMQYSWEKT